MQTQTVETKSASAKAATVEGAPASYGEGGAGARIRFGVAPCEITSGAILDSPDSPCELNWRGELGFVLVARTDVGVCSITLGEDEAALEAALRAEFFAAPITRDAGALQTEIAAVLAMLSVQKPSIILPFDVRATPFQRCVWDELRRIPRGETVSYSELAARLEMPRSVRAVAAACGRNPVALWHPCHRVVGKNGALSGYRWGIERKRALLNLESRSE